MQGLSKAFLKDPANFLRMHALRVHSKMEHGTPFAYMTTRNPPVYDFDLKYENSGVTLIPFAQHTKTHLFGTQRPIAAYWLHYCPGTCQVIQLGNQADYLFTPVLDGCYVGVGNGAVTHVAGDVKGSSGGTQAMRNIAAQALGGNVTIGFDSNPADAQQFTFVGVRRNGLWSFYIQGHQSFGGPLENIFQNTGHVLQLTDLTYG